MDPRGITHGSLKLSLYQLNGEVLQTIKIPTHTKTYRPVYSQNGEYMVVPVKVCGQILYILRSMKSSFVTYF